MRLYSGSEFSLSALSSLCGITCVCAASSVSRSVQVCIFSNKVASNHK